MSKLNKTQTNNQISTKSQSGFGQVDFLVMCWKKYYENI